MNKKILNFISIVNKMLTFGMAKVETSTNGRDGIIRSNDEIQEMKDLLINKMMMKMKMMKKNQNVPSPLHIENKSQGDYVFRLSHRKREREREIEDVLNLNHHHQMGYLFVFLLFSSVVFLHQERDGIGRLLFVLFKKKHMFTCDVDDETFYCCSTIG